MVLNSETDTASPGLWYGRRKCIPATLGAIVFAAAIAVTANHPLTRITEVAIVAWGFARIYSYWSDPMPARYAERLAKRNEEKANQPRFGTKLWHKVALGFLIAVALLFVFFAIFATLNG